jgi:hypothetical protein
MTQWIMEDEEYCLDLLDLYEEARKQVDQAIPRRGDNQAMWLSGQGYEFVRNWLEAHFLMDDLRDMVEERRQQRG